jgi:non-homologous end joining protein Ku
LYRVEPYELHDVKEFDNTHYIIPKEDLESASAVSKKRIRIINFYEKQNMKYNKEFSTK